MIGELDWATTIPRNRPFLLPRGCATLGPACRALGRGGVTLLCEVVRRAEAGHGESARTVTPKHSRARYREFISSRRVMALSLVVVLDGRLRIVRFDILDAFAVHQVLRLADERVEGLAVLALEALL